MKSLPKGVWGGPHIIMEVSAEGATITSDCADGLINEPVKVDAHGRFRLSGTYKIHRSGPVRSDETPATSAARYEGQLVGETLKLIITLPEKKERAGEFLLKHGEVTELTRCM